MASRKKIAEIPPNERWWQKFGNLAQIVSALIAFLAAMFVAVQINVIRTNSQESSARQIFLGYMTTALQYPEYAIPNTREIFASDKLKIQYSRFVELYLFAYDEVLGVFDDQEWKDSARLSFPKHAKMICSWPHQARETYYQVTRDLIREIILASSEPECIEARKFYK